MPTASSPMICTMPVPPAFKIMFALFVVEIVISVLDVMFAPI
jgi:hypothetical protein